LSVLARKHSQDMADQAELNHLSSIGETYDERLERDGFYFMDIGENIAFSETFQADFIHQSLMESEEHRENILTPNFNRIGIGVIYVENKGYYITQDFIQSFEVLEAAEIKGLIQKRIDAIRRSQALPPLVYKAEANKFALEYSKRKAEKRPTPPFPPLFGETHVISIATPSLHQAESVTEDVINAFYGAGGLGVILGRNRDYPGGTYFITLLLFPDLKYKDMEINELRQIILQSLNNIREKEGLDDLKLDNRLSEEATRISLLALSQEGKTLNPSPRLAKGQVITYATEGPYLLPEGIGKAIERKGLRKVGVGILFGKSPTYPQGAFWVTVVLN